ncbi:H-type small acid-soluble spore protein [Tenuibacillus multivorans]|uniref:Small, acid-soluble spore protein H n=1 Tax=Tenuibacillus multivorans TaxID=237069 RepID=A0A1G9WCP4_9BACI|nr:H-type small acid-soluble spore protein [Tenuibacillus multivorans]GEL76404.1 small, acid-soluble spore protein H [Tenuibacillus multivorans]SDM82302.1 small acid-soluble spore protein H (minor) [Tenuibacillus multivorans]
MDLQELKQIVESPSLIQVRYRGFPVYVQDIDENSGTATVFPLDNMDHVQEVDLSGLYEDDPIH